MKKKFGILSAIRAFCIITAGCMLFSISTPVLALGDVSSNEVDERTAPALLDDLDFVREAVVTNREIEPGVKEYKMSRKTPVVGMQRSEEATYQVESVSIVAFGEEEQKNIEDGIAQAKAMANDESNMYLDDWYFQGSVYMESNVVYTMTPQTGTNFIWISMKKVTAKVACTNGSTVYSKKLFCTQSDSKIQSVTYTLSNSVNPANIYLPNNWRPVLNGALEMVFAEFTVIAKRPSGELSEPLVLTVPIHG